jgi:hypothetical protein
VAVPPRRRRLDPTGHYRACSTIRRRSTPPTLANADPARRANAQLKTWKILRKIRSSSRATTVFQAVQALILAG